MNKNVAAIANQTKLHAAGTTVTTDNVIYALIVGKHFCGKTESQHTHDALHYFDTGSLTDLPYVS
ncbi:MAG: hypothetical protein AB1728_04885 [Bacteroidota bacterium]